MSALDDMRIAGLIMKIAGGMVLWTVIAIVFFRWYSQEEGAGPRRVAPHADREPIRMGLTEP
ncbi:MAG: cytochrome c oxidase assembly protein [Acidimicrobiia bacterium]|nr:cytochrome c oxidase assembly protein [Acidimicrobiia bacterium]